MPKLRWVLLVCLGLPSAARAATFTLNNNVSDLPDINPGDGVCETGSGNNFCTMRAAIMEANASAATDTIQFDPNNGLAQSAPTRPAPPRSPTRSACLSTAHRPTSRLATTT